MPFQSHDPRHLGTGRDETVVLPAREARQASRGGPVRNVLVGGLVLVILAFAVIYLAFPH